jgi:hypothetical protein
MKPSRLARMVNQVGNPAMFEGKRFFPLTGIPIWKMARISTLLADWLPEPLTVATCMLKSLTTSRCGALVSVWPAASVRVLFKVFLTRRN